MKKLLVLVCALFLTGTLAFAQSEKTVKQENKVKTEKQVVKPVDKKDAKAETADKKVVKDADNSSKKTVKMEAIEKKEAVETKSNDEASKKKTRD